MARAVLTVQSISDQSAALTLSTIAIDDGVSVENENGNVFLLIEAVTAATVTLKTPMTVAGLAVPERTYTLGADAHAVLGPFSKRLYNQADGTIHVDSSVDDTKIAAFVSTG